MREGRRSLRAGLATTRTVPRLAPRKPIICLSANKLTCEPLGNGGAAYCHSTGCTHYLEEPAFFLLHTLASTGPQTAESLAAKIKTSFDVEDANSLSVFIDETIRQLTRLELIAPPP